MSLDSSQSSKSRQHSGGEGALPQQVLLLPPPENSFSYVQLTCSLCKFKKRKCDGGNPCSHCEKSKQTCVYFADYDRRRRKYHTDYINYLEDKSAVYVKFINEFVKDSPEMSNAFQEKLSEVIKISQIKTEEKVASSRESDSQLDDRLLQMFEEASNLKLDEDDNSRVLNSNSFLNHSNEYYDVDLNNQISPYSQLTSSTFDTVNEEDSNPLAMNGLSIFFKDENFRTHLTDCFEDIFAPFFHSYAVILPEVRQWAFSSSVPSRQLLMCSIFAVGAVYSDHPYARTSRRLFITELEYIAVDACRHPLDIYLVMGLSLLSMYELGMGNDSISYLFDSMACSLTQHMGLHISYDEAGDSKSANYAPSASPVRSSILWGICLQDRIITSLCNVQACIHFKRIIAPTYCTVLGPEDKQYISELSFASQTRLWYIFDRFMDQICSENGDIGDTHQRTKLLETALSSLSEFKNSLPSPLMLTNENNNKYVMMLHYTYYGLICQLHRTFIKVAKHSSEKLVQNSVLLAKILARYQTSHSLTVLPYYVSHLIYLNALTYLIVLTKQKSDFYENLEQAAYNSSFRSYLSNCVDLLKALSNNWKRPERDLIILKNLCMKAGIHIPELNDGVKQETEDSMITPRTQTPDGYQEDITNSKLSYLASPVASSSAPGEFENDPFDFGPSSYFNNVAQPIFNPPIRVAPPSAANNLYQQQSPMQQHMEWEQHMPPMPSYSLMSIEQQEQVRQQPSQQPSQQPLQQPIQQPTRYQTQIIMQHMGNQTQFIPEPMTYTTPNNKFLPMTGEPEAENHEFENSMNQFHPSFNFNNIDQDANLNTTHMNNPTMDEDYSRALLYQDHQLKFDNQNNSSQF